MPYGNLYEFVQKKYAESGKKDKVVAESELREAIRLLEGDGVITTVGNNRQPVIRFIKD